jgi:predicted GH43/DUF377 family glycosyl hydrolase
MKLQIRKMSAPILIPQPGCDWADTMVLNPAVIPDPADSNCYHMLFRATGPYPAKRLPGRPLPYPIFLGYAVSHDKGATWDADFETPALAPTLNDEQRDLYRINRDGKQVVNHANGCIEDPRLFPLHGRLHMTTACRMFPPGPYWEHDEPMQCAPAWAKSPGHEFGKAASCNYTVNVLWAVDLESLKTRNYAQAFSYITHLTNAEFGENRDVVAFPESFEIDGEPQTVMIHRPVTPAALPQGAERNVPSIYYSNAKSLESFASSDCNQSFIAGPLFDWEDERIGASTAPIRISPTEWLLPYHGKKDQHLGYTQSFMILQDDAGSYPKIKHRCPERLFIADQPWEQPKRFLVPCVFTTGAFIDGADLVMSYGAADEICGLARVDLQSLIARVRRYDALGRAL